MSRGPWYMSRGPWLRLAAQGAGRRWPIFTVAEYARHLTATPHDATGRYGTALGITPRRHATRRAHPPRYSDGDGGRLRSAGRRTTRSTSAHCPRDEDGRVVARSCARARLWTPPACLPAGQARDWILSHLGRRTA